jgi:hypothetical protein
MDWIPLTVIYQIDKYLKLLLVSKGQQRTLSVHSKDIVIALDVVVGTWYGSSNSQRGKNLCW